VRAVEHQRGGKNGLKQLASGFVWTAFISVLQNSVSVSATRKWAYQIGFALLMGPWGRRPSNENPISYMAGMDI